MTGQSNAGKPVIDLGGVDRRTYVTINRGEGLKAARDRLTSFGVDSGLLARPSCSLSPLGRGERQARLVEWGCAKIGRDKSWWLAGI